MVVDGLPTDDAILGSVDHANYRIRQSSRSRQNRARVRIVGDRLVGERLSVVQQLGLLG